MSREDYQRDVEAPRPATLSRESLRLRTEPVYLRGSDTTAALTATPLQLRSLDNALVQFRTTVAERAGQQPQAMQSVAAEGVAGSGHALPHLAAIQRSFGHHDVSGVRAHTGEAARRSAAKLGARGYAMDGAVALGPSADLHTVAHEAAHVVQQRAGVQLEGGVGKVGDVYERHADAVADKVVRGESAQALLDSMAPATASTSISGGSVQRKVFINGEEAEAQEGWSDPMKAMANDEGVRDYTGEDEFRLHAAGQTDYLGNLPDGTWLRFNDQGINILGEWHDGVDVFKMLPAVGSTNFIYEKFADDDTSATPRVKEAYDASNEDEARALGIEGQDTQNHAGESMFPKFGFAVSEAIQYFANTEEMKNLRNPETSNPGSYFGKPVNNVLRVMWRYSRDLADQGNGLPPAAAQFAAVGQAHEAVLGDFLDGLVADGYIGDAVLAAEDPEALLEALRAWLGASLEAMAEKVAADFGDEMDPDWIAELSSDDKQTRSDAFYDVRDVSLQNNIQEAADSGVRYAGVGVYHLRPYIDDPSIKPSNATLWDMANEVGLNHLEQFVAKTNALRDKVQNTPTE